MKQFIKQYGWYILIISIFITGLYFLSKSMHKEYTEHETYNTNN